MATMNMEVHEFEFVERTRRKLQMWLALSRVIEETLADLVAAYTPLLAPLIPAAIGYENVRAGLGFSVGLAVVYAVVVEFLGLATTTTALQFRAWNKDGQGKKAPMWLALLMATVYLAVVLSVNVLLDNGTTLQKWVKAAASTFSIVGAVTMALRNEQAKRVAELSAHHTQQVARADDAKREAEQRALEAEERAYARRVADDERLRAHELKLLKAQKLSGNFPNDGERFQKVSESSNQVAEIFQKQPETYGKYSDWRQVPQEERERIAQMTPKEIMANYGTIEKTAGNWLRKARGLE